MRLRCCRRWLMALVLVLPSVPAQAQSFGFPWWRDAQFQKELSLTGEQSARIDSVFQSTIPALRHKKEELDLQEAELSRLIAANVDEALVIKQVDKVESIRAHLNKTRVLMLLHMRQVLSPEQRARLNFLYEQRVKDRGKSKNEDQRR